MSAVNSKSLWTQILGVPIDYCWPVTDSRAETQVGPWNKRSIVKKIHVCIHSSANRMAEEIIKGKEQKPGFHKDFV